VAEEYRWPVRQPADLRDGLTARDVVEALYAPTTLRMDNRAPRAAPTFLAVCAPTDEQRLIVVVCVREPSEDAWQILGAREATMDERAMWRKQTT
jgi:uncharacterized DUF497 family protein